MSNKEKIADDQAYKNLVEGFAVRRKRNGAKQRYIEIATNTGGGRISNFESLTYSPTLLTFVKWCEAAGIEIQLTAPRDKASTLNKMLKKRDADNAIGSIIDQIKQGK